MDEDQKVEGSLNTPTEEVVLENQIEITSDDEIEAHAVSNDSNVVDSEIVSKIEESYDEDTSNHAEIDIDLSKIEMDEKGIPVLTPLDRTRLLDSGLCTENFDIEVRSAHESINRIGEELSEEYQKELEDFHRSEIERLNGELKTTTDEPTIAKIKEEINDNREVIELLPKYCLKTKGEFEEQRKSAVNLLATYQNLSRKTLQELQDDGSILGLVSSTAISAFNSQIVHITHEESKRNGDDNGESYIKNEEYKADLKFYKDCIKPYENLAHMVNTFKESLDDNFPTTNGKDSNYTKNNFDFSMLEFDDGYKKFKKSILDNEKLDGESELDFINRHNEEEKSVDNYIDTKKYFIKHIQMAYFVIYKKAIEDFPKTIYELNLATIREKIEKLEKIYTPKYDTFCKKISDLEDKIYEIEFEENNKILEEARKNGLVNSIIKYSDILNKNCGSLAKVENMFSSDYFEIMAERYYNMVRTVTTANDDTRDQQIAKHNVNFVSMLQNNYITYILSIRNNEENLQWASVFDPESIIKNTYLEHKDSIDKLINDLLYYEKEFIGNISFTNEGHDFIFSVMTSLKEKLIELDKKFAGAEKNKKSIKNKGLLILASLYSNVLKAYETSSNNMSKHFEDAEALLGEDYVFSQEVEKIMKDDSRGLLYINKEFISSILHLSLGCTLTYAFDKIRTSLIEDKRKGFNDALATDSCRYLFHEFSIFSNAYTHCKDGESVADFFKSKSKTVSFQTINFEYESKCDIAKARKDFIEGLFIRASNVFKTISASVMKNIDSTEEKETADKEAETKVKKIKKPTKEEIMKARKDGKKKAKIKKEVNSSYMTLYTEYENLLKNPPIETGVKTFSNLDGRFFVEYEVAKDTRVLIKILFCKFIKNKENLKGFFDGSIVNKDNVSNISVLKSFSEARLLNNEDLVFLGEKCYYKQLEDKTLLEERPSQSTISINCRHIVEYVHQNTIKDLLEIVRKHVESTNLTGVEKDVVMKQNSKLDIKYFNSTRNTKYGDKTNLDFFKTNTWQLITYEVNYDIINKIVPVAAAKPRSTSNLRSVSVAGKTDGHERIKLFEKK